MKDKLRFKLFTVFLVILVILIMVSVMLYGNGAQYKFPLAVLITLNLAGMVATLIFKRIQ